MDDAELVAKIGGVVGWSMGTALLRAGEPYRGVFPELLKRERPDLFVSASVGVSPVPTAPLPNCWNRTCKTPFQPNPNQTQRYCSAECRRTRENELKRAARLVTKRNFPEVPRSYGQGAAENIYRHTLAIEEMLALSRMLIENLGGTFPDSPRHQADEAVARNRFDQPLSDEKRQRLLKDAQRAHGELLGLLSNSRSAQSIAADEAKRQSGIDVNMQWYRNHYGPDGTRAEWEAEFSDVGQVEDETQAATRRSLLQGIQ
ncbi:hypothetical protein ACQPZX_38615 [Actinoplanes sp. CA-142083]|uniref:hypothetical protein n=1 Tax=Actinoplanes sp. CA-142083 TaxID=3239903 RepID=UPI003D92C085